MADSKQQLKTLMSSQMTRKEFLTHMGAAILAVVGITGFLKSITAPQRTQKSKGFGSGTYGGKNV